MVNTLLPLGFKSYIPKSDVIAIYDLTEYMDDFIGVFASQHPNMVMDVTNKRRRGCYVETIHGKIYITSYPVDLLVAIYKEEITPDQQNEIDWIESEKSLTKVGASNAWSIIYTDEKKKMLERARARYAEAQEQGKTADEVRRETWEANGKDPDEMAKNREYVLARKQEEVDRTNAIYEKKEKEVKKEVRKDAKSK